MASPAHNFAQPHDRAARLYQLGLTETITETVVLRGLAQRQACTAFHTPAAPGTRQWEECHVGLRELLTPLDWKPTDAGGFSRVISPDGRRAITVATGDRNTGLIKDNDLYGPVQPRTKYSKGRQTRIAVRANQQLSMLDARDQPTAEGDEPVWQETWYLLVATTDEEVRYELSLPSEQDEKGFIVSWSERIVFPAIDIATFNTRLDDDDSDDGDDIDVPVVRI